MSGAAKSYTLSNGICYRLLGDVSRDAKINKEEVDVQIGGQWTTLEKLGDPVIRSQVLRDLRDRFGLGSLGADVISCLTLSTAAQEAVDDFTPGALDPVGDPKGFIAQFAPWLETKVDLFANVDIQSLVQYVLRDSYLESNKDLQDYAEKVKHINAQKAAVREHLSQLRECQVAFKQHCDDNGIDPESTDLTDDQVATMMEFFVNYETEPHAVGVNAMTTITDCGYAVDECCARAAALVGRSFDVVLPDAIAEPLRESLIDRPINKDKIYSALESIARFICYLGDCGTARGVFGAAEGCCDDVVHRHSGSPRDWDSKQLFEDFCSYRDDPANSEARSSLAAGDMDIIADAFGFPPSCLDGSTDLEAVVNTAMAATRDAWKNEILHGIRHTSQELSDELGAGDNKLMVQIFGSETAAYEAFWGDPVERSVQFGLGIPGTVPPPGCLSGQDLEDHIKDWEEKLNTLGEDGQLANLDLQSALQRQQQTLQLMSHVSKMLHDVAMGIIRKVG